MKTATIYSARWLLPKIGTALSDGAIAVSGTELVAVAERAAVIEQFPDAPVHDLGAAVILPGLVNAHSHLELTAMRGFLDAVENDFFSWLKKLTRARLERMTSDDLYVSAAWGACEAARAGVTYLGDASDDAAQSMRALNDVGLRAVVFKESFGPDPHLATENFARLRDEVHALQVSESALVRVGVSPHAPYTVCGPQLEMIADLAIAEHLPVMMHAAESKFEELLMREGRGPFAEGLRLRGIEWQSPGTSTIQYLRDRNVLRARPLLAHCINVDDQDLKTIKEYDASVAHCPKSNAKLGHGYARYLKFLESGVTLGFGSDSVASNNTCDILEEARFATLLARATGGTERPVQAQETLGVATSGGARALSLGERTGELQVGSQADFVVVSLEGAQQLPALDLESTLLFASSGRDILMTVVAGREIYRDGQIVTIDEERLRARMTEVAAKIRS